MSGLVERIEYILDPSVSPSVRLQRRAHLTNHDLRECIKALLAAARIAALEAEVAELKLDVRAQECLQTSAYQAGLTAGWNFCVNDNNAGLQRAKASTEHIAELRRIINARAALGGDHDRR